MKIRQFVALVFLFALVVKFIQLIVSLILPYAEYISFGILSLTAVTLTIVLLQRRMRHGAHERDRYVGTHRK